MTPYILPCFRRPPVHSHKEVTGARRRLGFSPWLLWPQSTPHEVFEPPHEIIRPERTSGRFRGPKARQRDGLGLNVDERGDAAQALEERRDRNQAVRQRWTRTPWGLGIVRGHGWI